MYLSAKKALSLFMVLFVLNLCIQVPVSEKNDIYENSKIEKKTNRKFLLDWAISSITDCESLSEDVAASLLEQINEVREDWYHKHSENITFQSYHTDKTHGVHEELLFSLMEDARFSPPPEQRV